MEWVEYVGELCEVCGVGGVCGWKMWMECVKCVGWVEWCRVQWQSKLCCIFCWLCYLSVLGSKCNNMSRWEGIEFLPPSVTSAAILVLIAVFAGVAAVLDRRCGVVWWCGGVVVWCGGVVV